MTTSYKEAFWIVHSRPTRRQTSTPTPSAGIRPATSGWIVRARPASGSTRCGAATTPRSRRLRSPRCSTVAATFLTSAGAAILKAGRREGHCATNGVGPDPRTTGPRLAGAPMVGQSIVPVYDCLTGQFESFPSSAADIDDPMVCQVHGHLGWNGEDRRLPRHRWELHSYGLPGV